MDEWFIKSALPALLTHDSSLALPAEPSSTCPDGAGPNDRNRRVQQQVQLTLARRSRRTAKPPGLVSGSVHLQRNAAKSFDAADGPPPYMKVNGLGFTNHSLTSSHVKKPSRRVEVSPPRTPESPRSRFNHTAFFYGTYSHPGPCPPQRRCLLPDYSFISDSFRPYTFSEARRVPQFQTSTAPAERFHQKSVRRAAAPQAAYADTTFQQSTRRGSSRSYRQSVVEEERPTAQGQSADTSGAVQADNGVSWLAQVRSQGLRHRRLKSYPPTDTSVEVDLGRLLDVETPIQKTQAHSVTSIRSPDRRSPDRRSPDRKSPDGPPELTMEKAVNLLSQDNEEETLVSAASYIQNQCLRSDDAKKIIYYLRGIEKLLGLLCSDEETVQRAAAGALRNVVYQNNENKMEVKDKDGLATILATLKSSRDVETRRELTGLLWNLSSHDILKESLTRQALSVLTKSVLVPSSGLSEGENPKDELLADATVFHNATGCLQNLSSAGPDGRRTMRECEDLIDSLVYYIRGAIADYKADDKSTENCVCILHNLSYQIEAELPKSYARDFGEPRQSLAPEPKALGCFAHRSAKITEHLERQRPLLEEKANPRGIEWLWSAITIRMYLSLIARSVRHCTQEAAVGALQNITAGNGALSEAITFTIVQRESGLHHVRKMLEEGEVDVKRTAVSLLRNLSRYQELHPNIVKQVLPELVEMLPNDDRDPQLPAEVTASLCHILNNLSQSDKQHVKAIVNEGALPKIIGISASDTGYGPNRASQAACVLLHTMWKHTDLHGSYKKGDISKAVSKAWNEHLAGGVVTNLGESSVSFVTSQRALIQCGYKKSDFINPRTTKAVNSAS